MSKAQRPTSNAKVNFAEKFALFSQRWLPKSVAQMNDYEFKRVRIQGDFVWHKHDDTDKVFIVLEGQMRIDFRDGPGHLGSGELFVVPKNVEHKPFAAEECKLLLVGPVGVVNTRDAGGELTAKVEAI